MEVVRWVVPLKKSSLDKTENQTNSNEKKSRPLKTYVKYSGLAFQILAVIAIGIWLGYWLDGLTGWRIPIFTLLGAVLSLAAVIIYLIRQTNS
jgi:F0F1-type ATP synthase assembly protein I